MARCEANTKYRSRMYYVIEETGKRKLIRQNNVKRRLVFNGTEESSRYNERNIVNTRADARENKVRQNTNKMCYFAEESESSSDEEANTAALKKVRRRLIFDDVPPVKTEENTQDNTV